MASSLAEQIIPSEMWPYVRRAPISNPPGSIAPGSASGTRSPTSKLVAPQITPDASSGGASSCAAETATRQYLIGFFSPDSSSIESTWAITTPRMSCPTDSSDSTSRPAAVSRRATSVASTGSGSRAYSRSQESGTRMSDLHPERPAEPDVAVHRVPDLGQPVRDHQAALDAEPEGEPAVPVGGDPAGHQDAGVDHAAARDLDPALRPAYPALVTARLGRGAAADVAFHRHVTGRLGEREVVRPEARAQPDAEHRVHEGLDRPAQVGHGQALVHREALDLVEDRAVGGVERVVPVGAARADHVQRHRAGQHGPDLDRRGLGAQHHAGFASRPFRALYEDSVLRVPGRVVRQHVERVEVVPFGLDLGALR